MCSKRRSDRTFPGVAEVPALEADVQGTKDRLVESKDDGQMKYRLMMIELAFDGLKWPDRHVCGSA